PTARTDEPRRIRRMLALVRAHPRFGYRRIGASLRREGGRVNRKRVYRVRRPPRGKDDVWAWDFIHDRTEDGRPLKWLSVVDEYTRECLVLEVRRGLP